MQWEWIQVDSIGGEGYGERGDGWRSQEHGRHTSRHITCPAVEERIDGIHYALKEGSGGRQEP